MSKRPQPAPARPEAVPAPVARSAAPWRLSGPPARALFLAGWALLPLRAFLGVTFCFAGLQKLANPDFFNANSASGIQAQLLAAERVSPLHSLLGHLVSLSTPIGIAIALAELAVGLGTLLGLWARLAALGGLLLSLTLFFTISFHASPYYTGSDIVFVFAWLPLLLAGSGGVWSFDAAIESRARRAAGLGAPAVVAVPFDVIQGVCGQYRDGLCAARRGAHCEVAPCPFLTPTRANILRRGPDEVDRRALLVGGATAGLVGLAGLALAGGVAGLGRVLGRSTVKSRTVGLPPVTSTTAGPSSGPTTTSPAHPAGTAIGPARSVPVGGAGTFTDPSSGNPAIVLQPRRGTFVAYETVCPHAGCTVGYSSAADVLVCPCHGSQFNAGSGAVETGPATRGLSHIQVAEGSDGQLYVS